MSALLNGLPTAASELLGPGFTALSVKRILLTTAIFLTGVSILELLVVLLRPDLISGRPRDLSELGRTIAEEYDFVVVGAGSGGSVVASRLSEVPTWRVLLLEAGGPETPISDIPSMTFTLQNQRTDWQFRTEPSPNFCRAMKGNRCRWPRGRILGGTSTINGMLYVRGNRRDYDNWAQAGNAGWSYDEVLPYFKKSEDVRIKRLVGSPYHATGGYLTVDEFRYKSPLEDILLTAGQQLGYDIVDLNGETQFGFSPFEGTVRDGFRCNAATAFLRPAANRSNLDISMNSLAEKVNIDPESKTVTGVSFTKQGQRYYVRVRKEIIVSAGAINSPKLLMLSGIGPREHLRQVGISPVISDLRVGYNLQDHIAAGGLLYLLDQPVTLIYPRVFTPKNALDFFINSRGPAMTTGVGEAMAFINTKYSNDTDYPEVALYNFASPDTGDGGVFTKEVFGLRDDFYSAVFEPVVYRDAISPICSLMHPKSSGRISLRDTSAHSPPLIEPNYLSHPDDVKVLVEAAKFGARLTKTSVFRELGARPNPYPFPACRHLRLLSDEYLECALREYTVSFWHYSGTCKMGPDWDPEAVVDPQLRVRGVRGLRVVDASIMPVIPTANLNAPTIMVAEKASDMIRADWA